MFWKFDKRYVLKVYGREEFPDGECECFDIAHRVFIRTLRGPGHCKFHFTRTHIYTRPKTVEIGN